MNSVLQEMNQKKKVAVGLSGGVDSSLTAALLEEQGYEVTGVFLECWRAPGCRVDEDRKDALEVALQLKIPYEVLDFKKEYYERVVDYFYSEYEAGRTPNPDTMCNREIKFGMFYDWAMKKGFDFVATGHYARTDGARLMRGVDEKKDQSYFLYQLRPEQLEHILFPLGGMLKSEVRSEAKSRDLKVANKPDSQGICFIGPVNVKEFLKERLEVEQGKVVIERKGEEFEVGVHDGVRFFTIGQKVGAEIDHKRVASLAKTGVIHVEPTKMPHWFVKRKDLERNILVIGLENEIETDFFEVEEMNWLVSESDDPLRDCAVRIRHGGRLVRASVDVGCSERLAVSLSEPVRGVASGQACVFYSDSSRDAVVLGGGIIV